MTALQDVARFPAPEATASLRGIERVLAGLDRPFDVAGAVRALIDAGQDVLPLPGRGMTLERWRCLARVGRHDLSLAKIFESHTDALAIADEIGPPTDRSRGCVDAVWASESPSSPLRARREHADSRDRRVILDGGKAWCSGARIVDRGFVTVTDEHGARGLAVMSMHERGITIVDDGWHAVGMRDSATAGIVFDRVPATLLGAAGAYLERPGFWHGGAGVAACWYGAAAHVGTRLRDLQAARKDVHARARLGKVDTMLAATAALLRECASQIDEDPTQMLPREVMRVRAAVADCCESVLREAMHALGPGPFCSDERLARIAADLPIFIRQVRGEHDLVAQAERLLEDERECAGPGWLL